MKIELDLNITDYELQFLIERGKLDRTFTKAILSNPIESLIGKSFPDQEGIFAGIIDGIYYFVNNNKYSGSNGAKLRMKASMRYCSALKLNPWIKNSIDWVLPTINELSSLYKNKEVFNKNCKDDEKWHDHIYWSSTEDDSRFGWCVDFCSGQVSTNNKSDRYLFRVIHKVHE